MKLNNQRTHILEVCCKHATSSSIEISEIGLEESHEPAISQELVLMSAKLLTSVQYTWELGLSSL